MTTATTTYRAGDAVELIDQVPGRSRLRPGLLGEVVVGDEGDAPWSMVAVVFPSIGNRPWQLHRRHLRRATLYPPGNPMSMRAAEPRGGAGRPHAEEETPC
jgi:hypothetical protein